MGKSVDTKKKSRSVALSGDLSDSMFSDEESEEELDSDEQILSGSEDEQDMDDSGRLRMRPDIDMGPEYAGRRSSRKNVVGGEESADEDDDDDELRKNLDAKLESLYAEGSSDEDETALSNWQMSERQDDELETLSREYEKLRSQEVEVRESLKGEEDDNYRKGQAVRNQRAVWDRALEIRISLQKVLSGANRLPKKQAKAALSENEEVKEAYFRLATSAALTLNSLVDLETALIEGNSCIDELYSSIANDNRKRNALGDPEEDDDSDGADNAWEIVNGVHSRIAPYRDDSLDRWQRKVQLTSGVVSKGRLRAFNQSISQQIATAMRDTSRLIGGMRLKNSNCRVLGESIEDGAIKLVSTDEEVKEEEGNPETFDDSEFYQNLLHEFLESSDPLGQAGRDLIELKKRTKNRKVVDRRASKGRKIRYNVMEPLLNFMAPSPMVLPPMTDKLFTNVFGFQKGVAVAS